MRGVAACTLALALTAVPMGAQQQRPAGWKVRLDRAGPGATPDSLFYVSMPPGWHVTTHRYSGIFYDPAWQAAGNFRITATIFLFPDSRAEGYGVFFAGRNLEQADQSYLYVLLRRDGAYLVKRRRGSESDDLVSWTPSSAVVPLPEDGNDNVKNEIVIEATADRVRLLVNGQPLGSWPRSELDLRGEGQVGLRLNHGLNLHVSKLAVEPLS